MPVSGNYNFGVEIESVVKPYSGHLMFKDVDWYKQLAEKLENRGIKAVPDLNSRYSKHPEYYSGKWFVTRDGSLKRNRPYVCMEVVSPVLSTRRDVTETLTEFWEAMEIHFDVQKDDLCGGHVHVTPSKPDNNNFTLSQIRKIAFASVVYEDFVNAILPPARRTNEYCVTNSTRPGSGLYETLRYGKTTASLKQVAAELKAKATAKEIASYMQGNRYVLWNFKNIAAWNSSERCTGTIEFRGGNQFLNTRGTLAWVAFVLGFLTLALEENQLDTFSSYISPTSNMFNSSVDSWWVRIKEAARKSRLSRYLPEEPTEMHAK